MGGYISFIALHIPTNDLESTATIDVVGTNFSESMNSQIWNQQIMRIDYMSSTVLASRAHRREQGRFCVARDRMVGWQRRALPNDLLTWENDLPPKEAPSSPHLLNDYYLFTEGTTIG